MVLALEPAIYLPGWGGIRLEHVFLVGAGGNEILTQFEHTVLGSNLGAASPALDVPRLATLLATGKIDLASLVTHRFRLDEINRAIEVVESGEAGRVVIDFT